MPPKKKDDKKAPAKKKEGGGGSKAKKKKWSKGKVKEKVANAVFFDKALYDKCVAEVPKFKLITSDYFPNVANITVKNQAFREALTAYCEHLKTLGHLYD